MEIIRFTVRNHEIKQCIQWRGVSLLKQWWISPRRYIGIEKNTIVQMDSRVTRYKTRNIRGQPSRLRSGRVSDMYLHVRCIFFLLLDFKKRSWRFHQEKYVLGRISMHVYPYTNALWTNDFGIVIHSYFHCIYIYIYIYMSESSHLMKGWPRSVTYRHIVETLCEYLVTVRCRSEYMYIPNG